MNQIKRTRQTDYEEFFWELKENSIIIEYYMHTVDPA